MMREKVVSFEIQRRRVLAPDGRPAAPGSDVGLPPEALRTRLHAMVRARVFDERAVRLQRAGQLGTYASALGQEAVAVGVGVAMDPSDVLVPSFREHGAQLLRGVTPRELLLFWGGDERGCDFAGPREDFPVCIPVGSHAPHAAGVAWALQLRGEARAAVCVLGDGATSKGDFYEAANVAGAWKLPVVFVVMNNQWAISVPRSAQSAAETLAQKAIAVGMPGEQVDGNDVLAVEEALTESLERARGGEGPSMIEALTYRIADHTTSDDATRYRDPEEVERHREADPILRLRRLLERLDGFDAADYEALEQSCREEIEREVEAYLAEPPQPPSAIFDSLHERLPSALASQREACLDEATRRG